MKIEALRTTFDADWSDAQQDLLPITREGNLAGFRVGDRLICLCDYCKVASARNPPWWNVLGFGWTKEQLNGSQGAIRIDPTVLVLGNAWITLGIPPLLTLPMSDSALEADRQKLLAEAKPQSLRALRIVEHPIPADPSCLRFIARNRFAPGDRVWVPQLRYGSQVNLDSYALTAPEVRLGVEAAEVQNQEAALVRIVTDHPYGPPGVPIPFQERAVLPSSLFPITPPPIPSPWRATF